MMRSSIGNNYTKKDPKEHPRKHKEHEGLSNSLKQLIAGTFEEKNLRHLKKLYWTHECVHPLNVRAFVYCIQQHNRLRSEAKRRNDATILE